MKKIFLYIIPLLIIACNDNGNEAPAPEGKQALEMYSGVTGKPFNASNGGYGRAANSAWDAGDAVGVFMYETDAEGALTTQVAANRKYTTAQGDGSFRADTENVIYFPDDWRGGVKVIAYYPYDQALSGTTYTVDLSDQSDQPSLDLLYSATNVSSSNLTLPLATSYSHRLTKLVLNINLEDGLSAAGFKATISSSAVSGQFDLLSGELTIGSQSAQIDMHTTANGSLVTAEAVLMPEGDVAGRTVTFNVGGKEVTWTMPAGTKWEQGDKYTYKVTITDSEAQTEPNYGWFETPVVTNIENTEFLSYGLPEAEYAHLRNYSLLFDKEYKMALWVAYPMCRFYRYPTAGSSYSGYWLYDDRLDNSQQINVRAGSYPDSNYDRGHALPSGDRRYSYEVNKTTYYLTNQTPQHSTLNRGVWESLEGKVRDWIELYDTVYVVTGPMLPAPGQETTTLDLSDTQIVLPTHYFKVLARYTVATNSYETVAYKMHNDASVAGTNYASYATSVADIEQQTGFTFFPYLSDGQKQNSTSW